MPSADRVLRVRCLLRDQWSFVEPVALAFGAAAEFEVDAAWDPAELIAAQPDVVIAVNDWPGEMVACLDAARARGIPSLLLQDGILEWRCQYENPLFGAGGGAPQHQPVLADRIACIGDGSARHLSEWGNAGRVDVTGMPRMDWLLDRLREPLRTPGTTVLVMTAKNPGFTDAQRRTTLRSLCDVRDHLDTLADVTVLWRVSRGLVEPLGIDNRLRSLGGEDLISLIDAADAVITTPSTSLLECMLRGRPVAALDYHNVPRFVNTAWTISARDHIAQVVEELLRPPGSKLAFQEHCLRDALRIDGPAAPRVAALLRTMTGLTNGAQRTRTASTDHNGADLDLRALYPDQAVFRETDVRALQVRLARLSRDNAELRERLRRQGLAQRLYRFGRRALGTVE